MSMPGQSGCCWVFALRTLPLNTQVATPPRSNPRKRQAIIEIDERFIPVRFVLGDGGAVDRVMIDGEKTAPAATAPEGTAGTGAS